MKLLKHLISYFDYASISCFTASLAPSIKYDFTVLAVFLSWVVAAVEIMFGLDSLGFGALLAVMVAEVLTGVIASRFRKEKFSSKKFGRFSVKAIIYLVLIAIPHVLHNSLEVRGNNLAASLMEWLYLFFIIQVVLENTVSIIENLGTISGKPKDHWLQKIKQKFKSF